MKPNDKYYRYWKDDDLDIRSCHECNFSEFKSKDDGEWIIYFTNERTLWYCDQMQKKLMDDNVSMECSLCKECYEYEIKKKIQDKKWMESYRNSHLLKGFT